MKKIPMRRCVATYTQAPKKELIRIVRTPEGQVVLDPSGKANGRGAYLLKTLEAMQIARKKGSLEKALECKIDESVYVLLEELIKNESTK